VHRVDPHAQRPIAHRGGLGIDPHRTLGGEWATLPSACDRQPSIRYFVVGNEPGQTKASRFLLTNSSTVIGWRPPISAR
jgi:hypothetical protein